MQLLASPVMALSNWDCLAFDQYGPSPSGCATSATGFTVEIYKNWLHLTWPTSPGRRRIWSPSADDQQTAIIDDGHIRIGTWDIRATRGPQNGVYVIAYSSRFDLNSISPEGDHHHDKALLVGTGVSGFTDPTEGYEDQIAAAGVDPLLTMVADGCQLVGLRDDEWVVIADDLPEAEWVGVLPSSVDHLRGLVADMLGTAVLDNTWPTPQLAAIRWDDAKRTNQGDRFFVEHGVDVPGVATAPGDAAEPLILQALQPPDGTSS